MKTLILLALVAIPLLADKKPEEPKVSSGRGASDRAEILATVHANPEAVKRVLGSDMKGYIMVVELEMKPRTEEGFRLDRDDFQLLTTDDGQKSKPYSPSQLVGKGHLVIKAVQGPTSGIQGQNNGPVWGGIGGTRPTMGPGNGGMMGNGSGAGSVVNQTSEGQEAKGPEDPMKKVLEEKELPQKQSAEPVKGLLYFPIEGKHKTKNIILLYRGTAGRIDVEFK
jgi:hypothetical protein